MAHLGAKSQKLCFVTIGATAAFDALIKAVLSIEVLRALAKAGYSKVLIQYGKDGKKLFEELVAGNSDTKELGISVEGFDFDRDGLSRYMTTARDAGGVVISHAGTPFRV